MAPLQHAGAAAVAAGAVRSSAPRPPTSRDLARLVIARAGARLSLQRASDRFSDAMLAAFRHEVGATVRTASPLLVALVEHAGLRLDDVAWEIRPATGWPDRPLLPVSHSALASSRRARRGGWSGSGWAGPAGTVAPGGCHGVDLVAPGGDRLAVHVVDHSLEVAGRVDAMRVASLFGAFRLEAPNSRSGGPLPPPVGGRLDDAVAHPALRGRAWRISAAEPLQSPGGLRLTVLTGSLAYSMPWAR